MATRKIVILNSSNDVVLVLPLNEDDLLDMGALAGFLSNPSIIEVDYNSQATIGWKYINGQEIGPGN
jgi:hypothetical protein